MEDQTPIQPKTEAPDHIQHKGKYELSLCEFPVSLLAKATKDKPFLEYKDSITGKNNEEIERVWRVYPDSKFGFGSASTLSTLYELFQIWKDNGFQNKLITFGSIYTFAQRKGIIPTNTAYETIRKDLRCLTGLVIEAKNAFWDNEKHAYVDAYFHLFERVRFFKDKPTGQACLPMSYIEASDELFGSVLANSLMVTDFSSAFFHSLKPTEQRLALYLSKMLKNQDVHKRDIMKLAAQLPLTTELRKKAKQQLKDACQGLMDKGFKPLGGFAFEMNTKGDGENIIFFKPGKTVRTINASPKKSSGKPKPEAGPAGNPDYVQVCLQEDILAVCGDEKSVPFYKKVARVIPREQVYQALAEVKEVRDLGTIRKSKGALFTKLIKDKAVMLGIKL